MSNPAKERTNIVLLGPVAVGKGFTVKEITATNQSSVFVHSMGDLVRGRFKQDNCFRIRNRPIIENGGLVPNGEVIPMANKEWQRGVDTEHIHFVWEGFFRDIAQTRWALEHGIVNSHNTVVINLIASKETLHQRHQHRMSVKPDGARFDEKSFGDRIRLHHTNNPGVLQTFGNARVRIIPLDADRPLARVAEGVIFQAKKLWDNYYNSTHLDYRPWTDGYEDLEVTPKKVFEQIKYRRNMSGNPQSQPALG